MPTYEYVCEACKHEFEEYQPITAKPLKTCPKCKKSKLRRLIGTGAALIFKGSGFYQTDYRSDSYKKAAKADSESSSSKPDAGKSDSSKSESKTENAAKPESTTKTESPKPAKSSKSDLKTSKSKD